MEKIANILIKNKDKNVRILAAKSGVQLGALVNDSDEDVKKAATQEIIRRKKQKKNKNNTKPLPKKQEKSKSKKDTKEKGSK